MKVDRSKDASVIAMGVGVFVGNFLNYWLLFKESPEMSLLMAMIAFGIYAILWLIILCFTRGIALLTKVFSKKEKRTEKMLWLLSSPGSDQIGRPVNIDGRTGKVIDGDGLTITVEWD